MTEPDPPRRRRWLSLAGGAVVVAVIGVLAVRSLDLAQLRAALGTLAPAHVVAVLALSLAHIAARALRYHRLVLSCSPTNYRWSDGARIFLLGLSAAAVTPARAGDLIKARLVAPYGIGLGAGTSLVLVERALDLIVITSYALVLGFAVANDAIRTGAAVLLVLVLAVVVVCSTPRAHGAVGRALGPAAERVLGRRYPRVRDAARDFLATWVRLFRNPIRALTFLAASYLIWSIELAKLWVLLRLLGEDVPIALVVAAYAASLIAGAVSALPFSEGVVGVTLVALLVSAGGIDPTLASLAVVLDRAASTLPPLVLWVGFALAARRRRP